MALSSEKKTATEKTVDPKPVNVDTAEAHTDRVAMVSRDKNGNADQSSDFEIIVPDDEKRVAENRPEDNQVS